MTLADVNVLLQAFRADSSDHILCGAWLDGVVNGESKFGISPQVLSRVVRIVTNPQVFVQPSELEETLRFCEGLMEHRHCVVVHPGPRHWEIFSKLCSEVNARGNLVPDAWYAALAIEWGCEWITLDRDYARFKRLRWSLPS
jgi:toxin-antitoxin system PIN domain toxin